MHTIMRPGVVLLAAAVVGVLGLAAAGASMGGADTFLTATVTPEKPMRFERTGGDLTGPPLPKSGNRKLQTPLNRLTTVARAYGQAGAEIVAQTMAVELQGESIRVVAQAMPGLAGEVARKAVALGIPVEGTYRDLVQLLVPVAMLENLASKDEIAFIRLPWEIDSLGSITGEGVSVIGADDWHAAGFTGAGVKVAILDLGFEGYQGLLGTDLPDAVVSQSCRADGDITGGGEPHGTAVAEIVYEIAPDATLYLANVQTLVEFSACVDWLMAQGVDIINLSGGFSLFGPGDGTGLVNDIVDLAKSQGILWVNAAGNEAQQHWMGTWNDTNANTWIEFSGADETNNISAQAGDEISIAIKWDDPFFESCNDYDLALYDPTLTTVVASSQAFQDYCLSGIPSVPIESLSYVAPTTGVYYAAIKSFAADGEATIHLYSEGIHSCPASMQFCVEAGSLTIPADNPSVLTAGAVSWNSPDSIESFSSRGPTGDGRVKPDLVAPNRVSGATYGAFPTGFAGTSAAAPHAAGAAALVKQWHPEWSAMQIHSFLTSQAIDLGSPGVDNTFGSGRLHLGAPKGATPAPTATGTILPAASPSPTATPTPTSVAAATATPTEVTAPLPTAPDRPEGTNVPTFLPIPTRTPGPTWTPEATWTPVPTWTPQPTWTPNAPPTAMPTPTFTSTPTDTPRPANTRTPTRTALTGDTSCDGFINPLDAALILQLGAGLISALPCPGGGDASGDGVTNPLDAALILQFSAGLISSLPP